MVPLLPPSPEKQFYSFHQVSLVFLSPSHRASHPHQLPVPIRSSDGLYTTRTGLRLTVLPTPQLLPHRTTYGHRIVGAPWLAFPIPRSWRHQWERGWEQHHGWGRGPYHSIGAPIQNHLDWALKGRASPRASEPFPSDSSDAFRQPLLLNRAGG